MPKNKFTADEVLHYLEQTWEYASETLRGERLRFKCSLKGTSLTYIVTHGDQTLYSGTNAVDAVDAYQRA